MVYRLFIGSAQFKSRLYKSLEIIVGEEVAKQIEFVRVNDGALVGGIFGFPLKMQQSTNFFHRRNINLSGNKMKLWLKTEAY